MRIDLAGTRRNLRIAESPGWICSAPGFLDTKFHYAASPYKKASLACAGLR
jgi:hypothetical protein